jgi:hypothetical protein
MRSLEKPVIQPVVAVRKEIGSPALSWEGEALSSITLSN